MNDHLIDRVAGEKLEASIVKPSSFKTAVLVQDAASRDNLWALLFVDDEQTADARAVLVREGDMSLDSTTGGRLRLLGFRNELDRLGIRRKELRFCRSGTYEAVWNTRTLDPECFIAPTFLDLTGRFAAWRAGKADWMQV